MVSCSITHLHYDDGAPRESEQGKTRPVASLLFFFFSQRLVFKEDGCEREHAHCFPGHGYTASVSLKKKKKKGLKQQFIDFCR